MTTQPFKEIGVALISDPQRRILIDRRLPTGVMANLWEFPGGKKEANETVEACIFREIKEELGVEVKVGDHLITINHNYQIFRVTLIVHHCQIIKGEPQPLECAEVRWVSLIEIDQYQFPEANYQIIEVLRRDSLR
jgi:mutator protein MutT